MEVFDRKYLKKVLGLEVMLRLGIRILEEEANNAFLFEWSRTYEWNGVGRKYVGVEGLG